MSAAVDERLKRMDALVNALGKIMWASPTNGYEDSEVLIFMLLVLARRSGISKQSIHNLIDLRWDAPHVVEEATRQATKDLGGPGGKAH